MRDEFEYSEPMNLNYRKGYKAAGIEIYERLLARGYSDEEARELAGVEAEDVEKYSKK